MCRQRGTSSVVLSGFQALGCGAGLQTLVTLNLFSIWDLGPKRLTASSSVHLDMKDGSRRLPWSESLAAALREPPCPLSPDPNILPRTQHQVSLSHPMPKVRSRPWSSPVIQSETSLLRGDKKGPTVQSLTSEEQHLWEPLAPIPTSGSSGDG